MKNFCKDLKNQATEIKSNEKKKEMIRITVKESESYYEQKACYICKKKFSIDDKSYYKVKDC